jgi:hypothetical protein
VPPPSPTLSQKPRSPKRLRQSAQNRGCAHPVRWITACSVQTTMKDVTRPDLIERYEKLEVTISQDAFEARHHLPRNLIGKMKQGAYASRNAAHTIARFEDALNREENGIEPAAPPTHGPLGRPPRSFSESGEDLSARIDLADAVSEADDINAVDECNKKVERALILGDISDSTARVLKELLAERRQALEAKIKQQERTSAGKEMLIRVVLVENWTGGPLPGDMPRS